ncbi:hypothetical protein E4U21_003179 [Claviceps maximensis]|nr:hypothetical protein E4U21_003179 [Claviceps maximensis]
MARPPASRLHHPRKLSSPWGLGHKEPRIFIVSMDDNPVRHGVPPKSSIAADAPSPGARWLPGSETLEATVLERLKVESADEIRNTRGSSSISSRCLVARRADSVPARDMAVR